jgi:predicted small metal-binding protein
MLIATSGVNSGRTHLKSFECQHGGVPCKAKVTGETEDEVLTKAIEHARKVHGVDLAASKTLAGYARSLIREEGAPASS